MDELWQITRKTEAQNLNRKQARWRRKSLEDERDKAE